MEQTTKYNQLLEELRRRYRLKYGQTIDDDLLIMIVRMNELEVSLKKQIREIQQPILKSKLELFYFSLGKRMSIITIVIMFINLVVLVGIVARVV